mgnify:CR=1 FL=1
MASNILDTLIKKTSVELNEEEQLVYDLVQFQWKSVQQALYDCNKVEISGLGVFSFREKTGQNRIKKLTEMRDAYEKQLTQHQEDTKEYRSINKKLTGCQVEIDYLQGKIDKKLLIDTKTEEIDGLETFESTSASGGVQKLSITEGGDEGDN